MQKVTTSENPNDEPLTVDLEPIVSRLLRYRSLPDPIHRRDEAIQLYFDCLPILRARLHAAVSFWHMGRAPTFSQASASFKVLFARLSSTWIPNVTSLIAAIEQRRLNVGTKPSLSFEVIAAAAMQLAAKQFSAIDCLVNDSADIPLPQGSRFPATARRAQPLPEWFVAIAEKEGVKPEVLYDQYDKRLRTVARRLTSQTTDADDVVHEVWLKFLQLNCVAYSDLIAAMITAVQHKACDLYRKTKSLRITRSFDSQHDQEGTSVDVSRCNSSTFWDELYSIMPEIHDAVVDMTSASSENETGDVLADYIVAAMVDSFQPRDARKKVFLLHGARAAMQNAPDAEYLKARNIFIKIFLENRKEGNSQ